MRRRRALLYLTLCFGLVSAVPILGPGVAQAAGPDPQGTIYVGDEGTNALYVYAPGASGNVAPERTIQGANTGIDEPGDVKVDSAGDIWVTNFSGNSITEYAPGASGDATPICTIAGSNTGLATPDDMSLEADGTIVVGNLYASTVEVFTPGSCGNVAPVHTLAGSNTTFNYVDGVGTDATGKIYVANTEGGAIDEFPAGSNGNVAPTSTISGPNTGLGSPNDVLVGFGGQLFTTSGTGFGGSVNSVTVYAPGASGNATPIQDITGSHTDFGNPDDLALDTAGNIFVTDASASIGPAVLEFASGATGNVAPSNTIAGPATGLSIPEGVFVAGPPLQSSPTVTTQVSSASISLGSSSHDTATVSGGTSPTGAIVFRAFGPGDPTCSAAPAYVSPPQTVSGDGNYTSPSFTPTANGTYSWQAEYSGDSQNAPYTTTCGAAAETFTVSSSAAAGCTMDSTSGSTTFKLASNQLVHIENTLSSSGMPAEHLVLRSLTGGPQYFVLGSFTSAVCHDNPSYGLGTGDTYNTFTGNGTGSYGTSASSKTAGYGVHIEIGDWGDSGAVDNPLADTVRFSITSPGGAVVWTGFGHLAAGSEEESG